MWSRWLIITLQMFLFCKLIRSMPGSSHNYKISPKPCTINSYEGTCMFVWECIKSEGQHIGMCVDSFMFGSCCAHNLTENVVVPQHQVFDFKPVKPNKNRPPTHTSNRPYLSNSGTTIVHRPHGGGTLVIRPSNTKRPHHHYTHRPVTETVATTVNLPNLSDNTVPDLDTASSISTGLWSSNAHTTQWHVTTQPNFITKPRPTVWEKLPSRPKPKPTKKPIFIHTEPPVIHSSGPVPIKQTTTYKPKPEEIQIIHSQQSEFTKKPTTITTTRPIPTSAATTTSSLSTSSISKIKPTTHKPVSTSSSTLTSLSSSSLTATTSTAVNSRPTVLSSSTSTRYTSTTTERSITTNDLSSPTDTNDILENLPNLQQRDTLSAARNIECGVPTMTRPETRIVGGKNAPFGRWPWQVSVRRTSFFGFSSTHRCGGAVINENWIATAGHCVDDLLTSQIRIRVGEYDFSHIQEQLPYVERAVAKKVVHPKYNFFTYEFDLALVKLDAPLEFAPHIAPICLPATNELLIGQNATVTGWGRLSEGGTLPSVLQEVSVPIVSNDDCKKMFLRAGRHEFIPDIFLCAGHETGGHDSCQGDSGGPLQVKGKDGHYFLAGIISWGIGCAEANLPGVCTRISKFTPWILEIVA